MNTQSIRSLFNNYYFFPVLVAFWGLFYFTFGERLPANDGLGWDGYRYASMARDFIHSPEIDSYLSMRVAPSFLIHLLFKLFDIPFSNANIVTAFEILNIFCLTLGAYYIKNIFVHLHISLKNQTLGFVLIFLNFACCKFIYYYPVLTDSAGFLLGIMILYYYLKNQPAAIILISLLAAFTWPPVFLQGLIFIVFPFLKTGYRALEKSKLLIISGISVLYFAVIIFVFVILKKEDIPLLFTLKIDQTLLPVSILFFLSFSFFLPWSIANKNFFSLRYLRENFNRKSLIILPLLIIVFAGIKHLFHAAPSENMTIQHFLVQYPLFGLAEPIIYLVSHATFYGVIFILILFFWKEMCKEISGFGIGLSLAFLFNTYLFNFFTESRSAINFFPWIVVFTIVVLEKYNIKNVVYFIFTAINMLACKVWLTIGYDLSTGLDKNGAIAFPNQKLFMNGPWMSQEMWEIQATIFVTYAILIYALLKFNYIEKKQIEIG